MFGQPQQYGYPQQGYGYQQPQRQPAQLSSLGDLLAGNSAKAYFGANSQPGDSVTGVIEKIETTQVNDFQTKQPAYWNDGRPKEQIHVIIQTQLRDPSVDDDDGRRSLWIKGWGIQLKAFREACRQAGVKIPKPGDTITERFVGLGPRGDAPQPPKVFEFHIEPASSVNNLVNGSQPQQPGMQQAQPGIPAAAVRAPAAHAGPESGICAGSGRPVEPADATGAAARPAGTTRPTTAAEGRSDEGQPVEGVGQAAAGDRRLVGRAGRSGDGRHRPGAAAEPRRLGTAIGNR